MKLINQFLLIPVLTSCFLAGCSIIPHFHETAYTPVIADKPAVVSHSFFSRPAQVAASSESKPSTAVHASVPATVAAAYSPVAAKIADIVYVVSFAGIICLLVCGLLFYLGQLIPATKFLIAGIVLPVSAVWFNYHYGIVIAALLISASCGFVWAVLKNNPKLLTSLENENSAFFADAQKEIKKI